MICCCCCWCCCCCNITFALKHCINSKAHFNSICMTCNSSAATLLFATKYNYSDLQNVNKNWDVKVYSSLIIYRVCQSQFWPVSKQVVFFEAAGAVAKIGWLQPKSKPPITKLSWSKSLLRTQVRTILTKKNMMRFFPWPSHKEKLVSS